MGPARLLGTGIEGIPVSQTGDGRGTFEPIQEPQTDTNHTREYTRQLTADSRLTTI